MKKLLFILSVVALSSVQAHTYKPSDLEQFESTNMCNSCDLSSAGIQTNHSGASLKNANLSSIFPYQFAAGINFSNANLQNANLSGANLQFANLSEADLAGARLAGASLKNANLYHAVGVSLKNIPEENLCGAILPNGTVQPPC